MLKRLLPVMAALLSAACATTPASHPVAAPPPMAGTSVSDDAVRLRQELQDEAARFAVPVVKTEELPAADIEAVISMPIPDNRFVRNAVTLFSTTMKNDIQTYLTRSAQYRKMIDRVLAEAQLPKALAYLPVIESGYGLTLTSRAGARGMWQFMEETAREYGLRVDWWIDERTDPDKSTRAAARYLKDLYRRFDDWPLALAAYNAGPGRIRRALENSGATSFWELYEAAAIPKETRGYVPTFFATVLIASDPASHGFMLPPNAETDVKRVELDGPVSLRYLSVVSSVDVDLLKELNPSFRRGIVPPGRHSVRVPNRAVEAIAARATTLREADPEIAVCSFRLREGDSLKKLARSLGVSVETLVAMNGLRGSTSVRAGDSVYLPVRARDLGRYLNAEEIYYAVRKGDTLSSIARRHQLSVVELRELNDLGKSSTIKPGQKLIVTPPRTLTAGGM